jgi:hypothetical protein
LAVGAFLLSAARINQGLLDSTLPAGPGLTLDESFNVAQGIYLSEAFAQHGPFLFSPSQAKNVFGDEEYLPDHPPLGRFLLGFTHQMFAWVIPGSERSLMNIPAARLGSCFAFAFTVLLLTEFTRRRYGLSTAVVAALMLMLMPRVIGHARLAALESGTTLTWMAAMIPLLTWWTADKPPSITQCVLSGFFWGLLMLTKIQGILLPPLILAWAIRQYRWKAIGPLTIWSVVGGAIFFFGWPWLWLDPVGHTMSYFVKASERLTLYVWYLGQRYADRLVPWHFPVVMTFATVPVVVWLGVGCRILKRRLDRAEQLLLSSVVWPLVVFAIPGTPVYDATRLFLVIMPAIALLAARGVVLFCGSKAVYGMPIDACRPLVRRTVGACLIIAALWAAPRTLNPFALCDYSLLVGGPRGAQAIGLESSYWADGLNGDFWNRVSEDSVILVAPVCHQFQLSDLEQLVPVIRQRNIRLQSFKYDAEAQRGLILTIHRLADLPPAFRHVPPGAEVIAEVRSHGVVLARLIDTTEVTWPDIPDRPE